MEEPHKKDVFEFGIKQEPDLDLNADEPPAWLEESVESLADSINPDMLDETKQETDLELSTDNVEGDIATFHITFLPESEDGVFKCTQCPTEYLKRSIFLRHLRDHQNILMKCPHCPRTFTFVTFMVKHLRQFHNKEKDDELIEKLSNIVPTKTAKKQQRQVFECFHCFRKFNRKGAYAGHIKSHTKRKTCKCPYCPKSFANSGYMKIHMAACRRAGAKVTHPVDHNVKECDDTELKSPNCSEQSSESLKVSTLSKAV